MTTVYTLAELESALKRREKQIVCRGAAATTIRAKAKKRKRAKRIAGLGLLAAIGDLALAPLTGGASAVAAGPAIYGLTATGSAAALTASTAALTISTTELAILVGGSLAMIGLIKGRRIKFNTDGSVLID